MKPFSDSNTYKESSGARLTRGNIERKIKQSKAKKIDSQLLEHGYNFCEECGRNASSGEYLDCAHTIPVKECLESSRAELAYNVDNIRMLCRPCHRKQDKTFIGK